jgi:glutaredoxin-related protein
MAALLVFSQKCKHSIEILNFLESTPQLKSMVQVHDVNRHGVPAQYSKQITRVPTLLTKNGKILVGNEIKVWLESLLPNSFTNCDINSCKGFGGGLASFDGNEDAGGDNIFLLDNYGQSLQPAMTPEIQNKINKKVTGGNTYS